MKILLGSLFFCSFVWSDNLDEWIISIQNKTFASQLPALPQIKQVVTKNITPLPVNIFSANRFDIDGKKPLN